MHIQQLQQAPTPLPVPLLPPFRRALLEDVAAIGMHASWRWLLLFVVMHTGNRASALGQLHEALGLVGPGGDAVLLSKQTSPVLSLVLLCYWAGKHCMELHASSPM